MSIACDEKLNVKVEVNGHGDVNITPYHPSRSSPIVDSIDDMIDVLKSEFMYVLSSETTADEIMLAIRKFHYHAINDVHMNDDCVISNKNEGEHVCLVSIR